MPSGNSNIGDIIRRGVVLFSTVVPIPAPTFVAAVSAAVLTKILDIHEQRVSEILSVELTLPHISRVEPDDEQVVLFFARNPVYPELESEFDQEIRTKNIRRLRELYPLVHNALVLKKQIPALLYHKELENREYRNMALQYEQLVRGFQSIEGDADIDADVNHFAADLYAILREMYEPVKDEFKTKKNEFAFQIIDYILEVASI